MNSVADPVSAFSRSDVSAQVPRCAFTVDVEDWYQSSVDFDAPISERVLRNMERLLSLLEEHKVKGSFFVQGLVALKFPKLLQTLVNLGHEVQSHGHTHRPLYKMSPAQLRLELELARKSVEDACGVSVTAFRAPDFSILHTNLWALAALAENGFRVDSSIFPMRTSRYGIAGWDNKPLRVRFPNGKSILEAPVAVWKRGAWSIPVAGGGYLRVLPGFVLRQAIADMLRRNQRVIIYCHPYEFSENELRDFAGKAPARLRFTQGLGRASVIGKVARLFKTFSFGRFDEALSDESRKESDQQL